MSKPLIRADQLNASVSGTSSFNILEPADDDLIRVGYISTDRGYIKGIGKCEANEIAKKDEHSSDTNLRLLVIFEIPVI